MANGKKSFVMYYEWDVIFSALPEDKCGELVKTVYGYLLRGEDPDYSSDLVMKISWSQIKNQLDRDAEKYKKKCEQLAENGKAGGIASGKSRSKCLNGEANASKSKQNEANEAVDVDVSVDAYDNENVVVCDNEPSGAKNTNSQIPSLEEIKNEILSIGFTEAESGRTSREFYKFNESRNWNFLSYAIWQDKLNEWLSRDNVLKGKYAKLKNRRTKEQKETEERQRKREEYDKKYWDNDDARYDLNKSPEAFVDYVCGDRHYSCDDDLCRRMRNFFVTEEIEQMYIDESVEFGSPDRNVIRLNASGKCAELIQHFLNGDERSCRIELFVWSPREEQTVTNELQNQFAYMEPEEITELPFQ